MWSSVSSNKCEDPWETHKEYREMLQPDNFRFQHKFTSLVVTILIKLQNPEEGILEIFIF